MLANYSNYIKIIKLTMRIIYIRYNHLIKKFKISKMKIKN
jgi:hypothetical protein